jgi:hypothetical protein
MDNTVTLQGSFVGTGNAVVLPLRSGVDWMRVYNYTQSNFTTGAGGASYGVQYNWFRGMAANDAFVLMNNAGSTAVLQTTAAALTVTAGTTIGGFTFIDSSLQVPGPSIAYSAGTNAAPPVITVADTSALFDGTIVRITTSATAPNASGLDYSIHVINGTTFSLRNMIAPGAVFGAGTFRVIAYSPIFYPRNRVITKMASVSAGITSIQTSVDEDFQVGQTVRLNIPAIFGVWNTLNGVQCTVIAVTPATGATAGSFQVNVDSTGFAAFAWPSVASVPFTPAQVDCFGNYTDATIVTNPAYPITNPNQLTDATTNRAFIGMSLAAGITSPAGSASDVIYWQAGTVFDYKVQPVTLF